jgi:hypothetical protein
MDIERTSTAGGIVIVAMLLAGCGGEKDSPWSYIDTGTGSDVPVDPWPDSPAGDAPGDAPWDPVTDTVGCSDYVDTDGDTIADHQEGDSDLDADGQPNSQDTDSDNDTIPDSAEAGDADLCTAPRDTDHDTTYDFLDPDSDNDGVSDSDEMDHGTDPLATDSDGDEVSDLVETVYGSDPLDDTDTPQSHGDFVFVVDHMAEPEPPRDTLVFGTDIQIADVYITIDTSGSMSGEVLNLQETLQSDIVPGIEAAIPNVQMGVMRFEDCPSSSCANSIANLQSITDVIDDVQSALDTITEASLCGGSEPYALALYVTATGDVSGTGLSAASCGAGYLGYPCFRPGAIPIVIQIGDEPFCQTIMGIPEGGCTCTPRKGVEDAYNALNAIHAKYIGVNTSGVPGPMGPRPQMEEVALYTGSHDGMSLFVFDGEEDGTGLGMEIVNAVSTLAGSVPLDISAKAVDVEDFPGETVDTTQFVARIEPNAAGGVADPVDPSRVCVGGLPTGDFDGDGYQDYFDGVTPGTIVCFDIVAAMNTTVERIPDEPQLYTAIVQVVGDLITVLDEREIFFLIPPDVHVEIPI